MADRAYSSMRIENEELRERLESALDCCHERADKIREQDERIRQLDALAGEMAGAFELAEERANALAAHLETLKLSFHELVGCSDDAKEPTGYVLIQECDFDCVIADFKRIPDITSLARRDALQRAEALESAIDYDFDKEQMAQVAALLRRHAQGANNEVEG